MKKGDRVSHTFRYEGTRYDVEVEGTVVRADIEAYPGKVTVEWDDNRVTLENVEDIERTKT
jgi:hypothetical protein